ncbi:MAG: hypothetical protein H5U05_00590 [Candidatus Aminicenantes bacterium]|nr:hypothetical protein [Candidatus Aminicenantes bacterium]
MKIVIKGKERQAGQKHRWLKVVWPAILVAVLSFSAIHIFQAQGSWWGKKEATVPETGGQTQKAEAATVNPGGQKGGSSGNKAGQKARPTPAPAKTQPARSAPSSLKSLPEKTLQILKENRFLEEELKLAKSPKYYFVLNLREKTLELRARGMVLKSWKASELRYTGKPVPLQVTTLTNKTALKPPERKVLNPAEQQAEGEKKAAEKAKQEEAKKKKAEELKKPEQAQTSTATPADTFEVEALEITDMPGSYELNFDDGLRIFVRSKSGLQESFRQTWEMLLWYTWYPVRHFLWRKSELRPQLILYFDDKHQAQGIYWAFIDGIKGIIWFN